MLNSYGTNYNTGVSVYEDMIVETLADRIGGWCVVVWSGENVRLW
jgi:hypothetical protein